MNNAELEGIVSFGQWVQQRRQVLGLTQAALAEQVGCAVITVKKIEQDGRRPSLQMAQLLADHLAIPDWLRDDFVKMGRGQYVPLVSLQPDRLRPPAFLQHLAPSARPELPPFVGRLRELAWLENQLAQALAGNGRVVFVVGEAGRGKTRLMAEFARRAQEEHSDLVVASGNCNAQEGSGLPYLPFRDVLGMLAGDLEARWLAGNISQEHVLRLWALLPHAVQAIAERGPALIDTLIPATPLIRRLIPYVGAEAGWLGAFQSSRQQQQPNSPPVDQDRLLDQVSQVLRALARRKPLLILLDDLQWIDDASKNLLFHLGRRLAGTPLLLLAAYRPSEIALGRPEVASGERGQHPLEPVISEFKRFFGDVQLDLGGLDAAEGRAFVDDYLDSEPNRLDEAFRSRLFQHTGGHPLFTVEILRNMQESGNLVRDENGEWIEGAASRPRQLPPRVEAVIEQRVNRLDAPLRDILIAASVEGERFTAQVVADVLGSDERLVMRRLSRELQQRHRLVQEHDELPAGPRRLNRYQFAHNLFQEYLYSRLGQGEKRLMHRDVGENLEKRLFGGPLEISAAGGDGLAAESGEMPEHDDVAHLLDSFGPALAHHFWLGEEWLKAAAHSLRAGSQALKVFALREALDDYARAVQALDNIPSPPAAMLFESILGWVEAAFKLRPYAEQLRHLTRAEIIARELGDDHRLLRARHWTANVYLARGLWTSAGPALLECLGLAQALGEERLAVRPTYFQGLMKTFVDPRAALDVLDEALRLAHRHGDPQIAALALGTMGQMQAQLGQFAAAQEALQQARESLQHVTSPLTESDVDLLSAWACLAMGDVQHSLAYGRQSVEKAIATDNLECICSAYTCVGYGNLEMQRIDEAAAAFDEAIERSQLIGAITSRLLGQAGLAMTQFWGGRAAAVNDLEMALVEMKGIDNRVGAANAAQMLGACLMQAGDLPHAEENLAMARDFYQSVGMRPYLLRALSSLAQLYRGQERSADAQACQAAAAQLMRELAA